MGGLEKRGAQFRPQFGRHIGHQIERWRASAQLKILAHVFRQMQDVVLSVYQHTGRHHLANKLLVQLRKAWQRRLSTFLRLTSSESVLPYRLHQQGQVAYRMGQRVGLINAIFFINDRKKIGRGFGRLGSPEKQKPPRLECKTKHFEHPELRFPVKVNQQIAATHQIKP